MMIKKTNTRNQIILVVSMFALLIAAYYFDIWQVWLIRSAGSTFQWKYTILRLWSVPVAGMFFSVCWLVLFPFLMKHNNKIVAALFLVIGICILFYPSIVISFGVLSKIGIPVNYFSNSVFFYSSALVAAIGLIGLLVGLSDAKRITPEPELK